MFHFNKCLFKGCNLSFPTVYELVYHVENSHIETDPSYLEELEKSNPANIAASYIFRYNYPPPPKPSLEVINVEPMPPPGRPRSGSISSTVSSTVSYPQDDESDGDDSVSVVSSDDDSIDATFVPHFRSPLPTPNKPRQNNSVPGYVCQVSGCPKVYKGMNSLKYHMEHAHSQRMPNKSRNLICQCGRAYKTLSGLRSHSNKVHGGISDLIKRGLVRPRANSRLDFHHGSNGHYTVVDISPSGAITNITNSTSRPFSMDFDDDSSNSSAPIMIETEEVCIE